VVVSGHHHSGGLDVDHQLGFTHIWLPMGSFACGRLMVATATLPCGSAGGAWSPASPLAFTQMVWRSDIIWLPYLSFWLWLLTTSVLLVRKPGTVDTMSG